MTISLGGEALEEAIASHTWTVFQSWFPIGGGQWSEEERQIFNGDLTIGPNSVDVSLGPVILAGLEPNPPSTAAFGANGETVVWPRDKPHIIRPTVDGAEGPTFVEHIIPPDGEFILHPRQFALACVRERFICDHRFPIIEGTPDEIRAVAFAGDAFGRSRLRSALFAPMYEGRSTVGRIGIDSHSTAGFGDYGFDGYFTLELYNKEEHAIALVPGMRIGQIAFQEVYRPKKRYSGAYTGQSKVCRPFRPALGRARFF